MNNYAVPPVSDGYELSWDATIEKEGQEFILAPAGDYDFTVISFERARHNGSDKMPPCNKAVLSIRIQTDKGPCTIKYNLFLHSKCEWKLCEFFTAIGQRKKGEKMVMNWNKVNGASGRCKVKVKTFISKTGKEMEGNEIEKFYEPEAAEAQGPAPAPGGYTPGMF